MKNSRTENAIKVPPAVAHIPDFGDAPTSPYEPLHDRDDQPCLIDVTDFNEILPIYSHK